MVSEIPFSPVLYLADSQKEKVLLEGPLLFSEPLSLLEAPKLLSLLHLDWRKAHRDVASSFAGVEPTEGVCFMLVTSGHWDPL